MRPLRIKIEGLRSFRTAREIDFSDLELVAIVGDTGAGKSSILEALTYALYNGSTWDQRGSRSLISTGANVMRVELDFTAEGEQWRIVRSTSRTNYPPSIHTLKCLTDAELPQVDGESAVADEVRRLVGLEHEGFCSAVVLPQGRFQELLQARKGLRTNILKSIFRLDQLGLVREVASRHHTRVAVALTVFTTRRVLLAPDPKAAAKEAELQRKERGKVAADLDKARKRHDELLAKRESARERERRLTAYTDELADTPNPAELLENLAGQYGTLAIDAAKLEKQEKEIRKTYERFEFQLTAADERGEGRSALETASDRLMQLTTGVPALVEAKAEAASTEKALKLDADELSKQAGKRLELKAASEKATSARDKAQKASESTKADLRQAHAALEGYRAARAEETLTADDAKSYAAAIEAAETAAAAAAAEASEAIRRREEARSQLEEINREHAAAHAAAGLAPGDPCPICHRDLPHGFHVPSVPTRDDALAAGKKADEKVEAANQALATAKATLAAAKTSEAGARKAHEAARKKLEEARASAGELLDQSTLDRPAEEVLRRVEEATQSAVDAFAKADADAGKERDRLVAFEAALEPKKKALADGSASLERRRKEIERMADALEKARSGIPKRFRPLPKATEFDDVEATLKTALRELESWRTACAQASADLQQTSAGQRETSQRRATLDSSWRKAHDELTELQRTLDDGVRLLGAESQHAPKIGTPADDAAAGKIMQRRLLEIQKLLDWAITSGAKDSEKLEMEVESLFESHEVAGRKELDDQHVEALGDERHLKLRVAELKSQITEAKDLDDRIGPLDGLKVALEVLGSHLTDSKFVAFAVERRQRALLGAASEILGRMTGDRYGFAADFDIVDKLTGQPRSTKTLSGGETFLASLALALGLVEMAGRSGGRLDALFLDEGFGALDADALDEALSELERRAASGRLVGVISHIGAVAERIETVLRVDRTPEGSDVRLVDQSGRWELVERELSDGLLT